MDYDPLTSSFEPNKLEEMGTHKTSKSDQTNLLQHSKNKSDSFVVDMEHFSHPTDKDMTANSRIAKSLSRKGCQRGNEKRMASGSERDTSTVVATSSPRASLAGASTPEKSMVVTMGATDNPINPQVQHQITIMTANGATTTATATESKWGGKRFNFRRSAPSWTIDPRRILIFFATLSSMGSILLIYFTLSMGKISEDDNALN